MGGLQAVALRQIEEMLGELSAALDIASPDGDRVYTLCEDLHARFKSMTTNATVFVQKVNKLLNSPVVETAEFALFKVDTINYLNDFIGDLDVLAAHIRRRLDAVDAVDPDRRVAALAAGQAASGQLPLNDDADGTSWSLLTEAHLAGLAEWFRAGAEARTGASVLYKKARDAVLGIARVAERIRESSSSPSSRSTDLLALAIRFEGCADDAAAHLLWHAAFGLSPARHLGLVNDQDVSASKSWWDPDSAVVVSRQLRVSGRTDYVRRAMRVADRSIDKRLLAAHAREQQQDISQAAETLVGLGKVAIGRINDLLGGDLEHSALMLLARLLSRAVRSPRRRDGRRTAYSVDGTLRIVLDDPLPPAAARVRATSGMWTLPNYQLQVQTREMVNAVGRSADDDAQSSVHGTADRYPAR